MNQSDTLPPCPLCHCTYAYEDRESCVCPECGHEWKLGDSSSDVETIIVKDIHGNLLEAGDYVTLAKDLKVKGSSSVAKIGTKVKILQLVDGDHNIDCKIDGIGPMMLKSEFVKKA